MYYVLYVVCISVIIIIIDIIHNVSLFDTSKNDK